MQTQAPLEVCPLVPSVDYVTSHPHLYALDGEPACVGDCQILLPARHANHHLAGCSQTLLRARRRTMAALGVVE